MAVSALAVAAAQPALENPSEVDSNFSSLSSSPRQFPTDLSSPILEECDETESEPTNEPVTPISGRQSQDFHHHTLNCQDISVDLAHESLVVAKQTVTPFDPARPDFTPTFKPPLKLSTPSSSPVAPAAHPPASPTRQAEQSPDQQTPQPQQAQQLPQSTPTATSETDPAAAPLSRRSTRGSSSSSFRRTMSSLFRKGPSGPSTSTDKIGNANSNGNGSVTGTPSGNGNGNGNGEASTESTVNGLSSRRPPVRRWSMNRSSATTRSNTPPSPGSPLEMAVKSREQASIPTVPNEDQFMNKKKNRASTGLHLGRARVAFLGGGVNSSNSTAQNPPIARRRASSFDASKQEKFSSTGRHDDPQKHNPRHLWGLAPEEGTGVKARRMSLSLPDDFTVDVCDLTCEYEYTNKLFGRHGKHLGKGTTSKVCMMMRKGFPGEIVAVKEFRSKMQEDTVEEYEKKIKSEYTLAKSLHHPNVIETIRLCTDHGRWNHVMEYCSEGDLFTLVKKGYLKEANREKDRLCLFKQLLQAVNYLHANGIAHRDIKLENLLMTPESRLKITDFGVSEVFTGIHPGIREAGGQCGKNMGEIRLSSPGICGSLPYISPEVLSKKAPYDPRGLDVWSSAIVMIYLIFGGGIWGEARIEAVPKNPVFAALVSGWEECNARNSKVDISEKDFPRVVPFDAMVKPPALKRVLLQMLNPDPSKRLTIVEVMNNRWIKNIECCQVESYDDPVLMIDASKKSSMLRMNQRKVFCHNHLPPVKEHGSHSLGKMPGQAGY